MKKTLLIALAASVGFTAMAQSRLSNIKNLNSPVNREAGPTVNLGSHPIKVTMKKHNPTINTIGQIEMGKSSNAFGTAFGAKTALFSNPELNTVSMIHRGDPALGAPSSGYMYYAKSTDGGATFTKQQGPLYSATGGASAPFFNARYPQALIYNPTGNTDPNNASIAYLCPGLAGTVGTNWGAYETGSGTFGGSTPTQTEYLTQHGEVPGDFCILQGGTTTIGVDLEYDAPGNYLNSILLYKGTWNGSDFVYTESYVPAPVALDNMGAAKTPIDYKIAFGPDGQTGYICILSHLDWSIVADSNYAPIVFKTTDGGNTWTSLGTIILDNCDAALGNGVTAYTTGFECDLSVDINENCHIICAVGPSTNTFSISNAPGTWGIFDFYSSGAAWNAQLIAKPETFRGTWVDAATLAEDSRPQIARTSTGDKLFFVYFDTDTALFGSANDNLTPDAWCAAFDAVNCTWVPAYNMTTNTNVNGLCLFGNVSPYVFGASGTYNIPVGILELTGGGPSAETTHYYVQGLDVTDAQFTTACAPTAVSIVAGLLSNPSAPTSFSVSQNTPNPFNGVSSFTITMKSGADVSVDIVNTLGQTVKTNKYEGLTPGTHMLTLDATDLNAGIYYYTVKLGNEKVTNKMIVK